MDLIGQEGSRTLLMSLMKEAEGSMERTLAISLELSSSTPEEDPSEQHVKNMKYRKLLQKTRDDLDQYIESRRGDALSTSSVIQKREDQRLKEVAAAKKEAEEATQTAIDMQAATEKAKLAAEQAQKKLSLLSFSESTASHLDDDDDAVSLQSAGQFKFKLQQSVYSSSSKYSRLLPDDWIDEYVNGHGQQQVWKRSGISSVSVSLPIYQGEILLYFAFLDMFHSLVHCSDISPAEKLALFKSHLRGQSLDAVKHLSGGEDAYKEALRRFKRTCGRKDVMRLAHMMAVDRLEFRRGDNDSFVQFAEEIRSHLFELDRLGERDHVSLIEKICFKLSQSDRQAWNEGRRDNLEWRSIEQFGEWLCTRAASYLNVYALAQAQVPGRQDKNNNSSYYQSLKPNRDKPRFHAQSNAIASSGSNTPKSGGKKAPFCFKCDKDGHRLIDCDLFKRMKVEDRVKFVRDHSLCFVCCGTKHRSNNCNFKRACVVAGCRLLHHILLHEDEPVHSKKNYATR